ncbi:1-(5-phosphoribosyl)-5-[(5-phosphoribosylamino)methylideneamino]imidazole-4-carboxamide isomerase [Ruminococcaceae bacterium OttesenSCG-928-L11]|nr:1-(5-phosphoribosyl)-5-[(5-phosphoribosylamino)methylideneamino]imidazole-4-carboxamide isomerase [Ruminococcaceae bacterium OttesenSCG-928-L11]
MEIFPSIDLQDGQVVRLTHGDFDKMDVYSDNPLEIARQFREQGGRNLHVVDLDGAKRGEPTNFDVIREIALHSGLFVEVGGGIRDEARIRQYLDLGVGRVILGTVAVEDYAFTCDMIRQYGKQIAVGVDARDGKIAVRGWLDTTSVDAVEFCKRLDGDGVSTIIYTDIAKDGAMQGTNLDIYNLLRKELGCDVTASGGISSLEELEMLREMGLYGAILGKSLYTGALSLKDVMKLC